MVRTSDSCRCYILVCKVAIAQNSRFSSYFIGLLVLIGTHNVEASRIIIIINIETSAYQEAGPIAVNRLSEIFRYFSIARRIVKRLMSRTNHLLCNTVPKGGRVYNTNLSSILFQVICNPRSISRVFQKRMILSRNPLLFGKYEMFSCPIQFQVIVVIRGYLYIICCLWLTE